MTGFARVRAKHAEVKFIVGHDVIERIEARESACGTQMQRPPRSSGRNVELANLGEGDVSCGVVGAHWNGETLARDITLAGEIAICGASCRHRRAGLHPTRASRSYAVRDEPCITRLTTMAAMPASTALACGDPRMSMIGFDRCGCSRGWAPPPPRRSRS